MKRHESIADLSRDHHLGLLFCWKIRQGLNKHVPAERIKLYVQHFWINQLKQHFEEEEMLLFAKLGGDELCRQAVSEHEELKKLVADISSATPVTSEQLGLLIQHLDKHIRFEERVLFPHLEKSLSDEVLSDVGTKLHRLHETLNADNYEDEFWV